MQPDECKVLRTVSKAHQQIGLPIFTHTPHQGCRKCALEQLEIYESQGVDPRKLCIGHLSDITPEQDPQYDTHKAIAKRGAFLGLDTVGQKLNEPGASNVPERQKVKMIRSLLDAGCEDQILLST